MGISTVFDSITGNPSGVGNCGIQEDEFQKYYGWMNCVRAVSKEGVSKPGTYDDYGRIQLNDDNRIIEVCDPGTLLDDPGKSLLIIDKVYRILKEDPEYENLIGDKNLYDVLSQKGWRFGLHEMEKWIHQQSVCVVSEDKKNDFDKPVVDGSDESYLFLDPDLCPENMERIRQLVELTINYVI